MRRTFVNAVLIAAQSRPLPNYGQVTGAGQRRTPKASARRHADVIGRNS